MNKRVLIVVNDFTTVYNFRIELVEYLLKMGEEVYIALPNDERNHLLSEKGAKVIDLKMNRFGTNPVEDFKTTLAIRKIIKEVKPNVVFTYTAKPNIYGGLACRITKTPYVANVTGLGANFEKQNIIAKIMLILQKIAYKKAKMVFFQNSSNLNFFKEKKVVKENFGLLPGSGVNLESNPFEEYPSNDITKFITIARVRKDKGYDELFYAIDKATKNGLNAEFHIVGWYEDDEYKAKVEAFKDNKNVVFYNGVPHEEVHKLLTKSDCLIHPSHHEGMSNVVLEAAACGRGAIVSNIPGCVEGVNNNETGFYFTVKDKDDLYLKISEFCNLPYEEKSKMGKLAREKIEKEFSRQIIINKYYEFLK